MRGDIDPQTRNLATAVGAVLGALRGAIGAHAAFTVVFSTSIARPVRADRVGYDPEGRGAELRMGTLFGPGAAVLSA